MLAVFTFTLPLPFWVRYVTCPRGTHVAAVASKEGYRMRERRVWRRARKPAVTRGGVGQGCRDLSKVKNKRSRLARSRGEASEQNVKNKLHSLPFADPSPPWHDALQAAPKHPGAQLGQYIAPLDSSLATYQVRTPQAMMASSISLGLRLHRDHMRWFWQASERRRYPRFKAEIPVIASVVEDRDIISLRTRCESISEGGVGTPGLQPVAVGDFVTLELHLPVSAHPIWVDTVVRYSSTERCGLEFRLLDANQRKLIKRYCRLQPKEKSRRWI